MLPKTLILALLWFDTMDVDPFNHIGAQLDNHHSIGVNLSDWVRTAYRILELVGKSEVILLPHEISYHVVMTNALGILL